MQSEASRLYHGTMSPFEAFDMRLIGASFEPNSMVGVWLSINGIWCELPGTDLEGSVCISNPQILRIVASVPANEPDLLDRLDAHGCVAAIDFEAYFQQTLERIVIRL